MDKFDATKLDRDYIGKICGFIDKKNDLIKNVCVNEVIRDDIFSLLTLSDSDCTVIYYPISDSENNGFHVNYRHQGNLMHFVYINTAQHKEKQVFTAAHELGHIWDVASIIDGVRNTEIEERVINRFASELLMPKEIFNEFVRKEIEQYRNKDGGINVLDMIKVITATMNYFFTSYKSVVYRLYEVGTLKEKSCQMLWGETDVLNQEVIINLSKSVAHENGYSRLFKIDNTKHIDGLKELLDKATEQELLSDMWLKSFYETFDMTQDLPDGNLEETLSINFEGGNSNES